MYDTHCILLSLVSESTQLIISHVPTGIANVNLREAQYIQFEL